MGRRARTVPPVLTAATRPAPHRPAPHLLARYLLALLVLALLVALGRPSPAAAATAMPQLTILAWHDVVDRDRLQPAARFDRTRITTEDLVAQFELLKALGYTPISLQHWIDARDGRRDLPERPVLLTFDDGYPSLWTKVFPLLSLYRWPAVAAIVGEWMEGAAAGAAAPVPETVGWDALRAMVATGLLEVASHTHGQHRGIVANPQGNEEPAATARRFDGRGYEDDAAHAARLRADLERSAELIWQRLGVRPRAIVWPYGEYSDLAIDVAARAGYTVAMNLDAGANTHDRPLMRLRRALVEAAPALVDFARMLPTTRIEADAALGTLRALTVRLDDVADPDPQVQEARLSLLLERVKRLGVNVVNLDAYVDPGAGRAVAAVYFPNPVLPMRADLLNRVAWQLRTRVGVKVFAQMPLAGLALPCTQARSRRCADPGGADPGGAAVPSAGAGEGGPASADPDYRRELSALFDDLGRHAPVAGVVFCGRACGGRSADRSDPAQPHGHADLSDVPVVDALAVALSRRLQALRPQLLIARRADARSLVAPDGRVRERISPLLADFDYVMLDSLPQPVATILPHRWIATLIQAIAREPGRLDRVVFDVDVPRQPLVASAIDGRDEAPLAAQALVRELLGSGARHVGLTGVALLDPGLPLADLRPLVSTRTRYNRED